MKKGIHLEIDRLSHAGYGPEGQERVRAAIETELGRLLARRPSGQGPARGLAGTPASQGSGDWAEDVGVQVARAIDLGLGTSPSRPADGKAS